MIYHKKFPATGGTSYPREAAVWQEMTNAFAVKWWKFKLAFLVAITRHTRYSTWSTPQHRAISEMDLTEVGQNHWCSFLRIGLRVLQKKTKQNQTKKTDCHNWDLNHRSLASWRVCYNYTTVAAYSLLEYKCSKLQHDMINLLQIENCLRDRHLIFDPPLSELISEIVICQKAEIKSLFSFRTQIMELAMSICCPCVL